MQKIKTTKLTYTLPYIKITYGKPSTNYYQISDEAQKL